MPTYNNKFIEVSALGAFETEIEKLNRRVRNGTADSTSLNATDLADIVSTKPTDYNYSNILVDNGSGRITSGLKSLELLSIIRSGTSPANLFLFDNIIFYGTALDFDTTNEKQLIDLVLYNLGMKLIVDTLSERTTAEYKSICLKVAKLVRTGNYEASLYSSYLKRNSANLVKKFLEI